MSPRFTILCAFLMHAVAFGGLFPRIADIQAGLGIDDATLGMALTTAAVGGLIVNLGAGRIIQAAGTKAVIVLGIPALAVLTAMVAWVSNLWLLFPNLLVMGGVFSLINVAINLEADRVEAATGRRVMNLCHGVWSAGMLITALGGTGARAIEMSSAMHLALIIPLTVVVTAATLVRMEASPPAPDDKMEGPRAALPTRRTLMLVAFGLSAGIAQSATQNWSVIFMEQVLASPDWVATLPLSAYLVAMTIGRFFADGWLERWGGRPVALILSLISLLGCLAVILAPNFWIALSGFALMGVGTAVLFPMMVTGAARSTSRSAAEAVSAVLLLTGVAMMIAPALMGWIAENYGLRAAFASLVPTFLLTVVLVRRVAPS